MSLRRYSAVVVAAVLVVGILSLGEAGRAEAEVAPCPDGGQRFFTVDGTAGHLHEMCRVGTDIQDLGVVDTEDWRVHQRLVATVTAGVTEIFVVTGDGRLLRRSSTGSGQPFGPPEQVGAEHDWSTARTLIAAPGAVVVQFDASPAVRVFDVTAGGLVERAQPLFDSYTGPPLSALGLNYAEVNHLGSHFRVYRGYGGAPQGWFSGALPAGMQEASGIESQLLGLDWEGRVVKPAQDWRLLEPPHKWMSCFFNQRPWRVEVTSAAAGFVRLVVPGRMGPWIVPTPSNKGCPLGVDPFEWQ